MQQTETRASAGGHLQEYHRLLAREPDSLRFAEYADLLRRAGELLDAREICERGLARHPGYSTGHVVMGDIYNDLGDPGKAEVEWRQALTLDSGHPLAHLRLGELHLSRGDTGRATAAFEAALIYSPRQAEACAKLAEITGAAEAPGESAAVSPGSGRRRPGRRPDWLNIDSVQDLVVRLAASPGIEYAAVVDGEGIPLPSDGPPTGLERFGPGAVLFAREAVSLLSRVAGGRLRSALARSGATCLRIVPLGEWTLIAAVAPRAPIGEVDAEIEATLTDHPTHSADEGDYPWTTTSE